MKKVIKILFMGIFGEYKNNDSFNRAVFQVWFLVFHATFNNISVISWRSILLVEETGVHSENQSCPKSVTNFIT
jgi:hypothetical protein